MSRLTKIKSLTLVEMPPDDYVCAQPQKIATKLSWKVLI
jgi:hypothetical protein